MECGKCIYYEPKHDNIKAHCKEGHFVQDCKPEDECGCEDFYAEDEIWDHIDHYIDYLTDMYLRKYSNTERTLHQQTCPGCSRKLVNLYPFRGKHLCRRCIESITK